MAVRKKTSKRLAKKKTASKSNSQSKTKKSTSKSSPKKKSSTSKRKRTSRKNAGGSSPKKSNETTLQIAITFNPKKDGILGPTKFNGRLNRDIVRDFTPDSVTKQDALHELQACGFKVTGIGEMSASIRGSKELFENIFGTKLSKYTSFSGEGKSVVDSFYYPASDAPWNPNEKISAMIDDAYIQWPHIYMNNLFPSDMPSPLPPLVNYHHLRVPGDIVSLLNVAPIHRRGGTGANVTVAMIDSGFAMGHQYFQRMDYNTNVVLAPGATDRNLDGNGHGTAECANLLAIAPGVNFIGVKLDNENNPNMGASLLEGFHEALSHSPDIISVSLGFDLTVDNSRQHLTSLPSGLVALEAEIEAAIANGITVVFSAGNGHVGFPGMMPDVISAGGVFVDADGSMQASDYASGFMSKIYSGRQVPDFSGLVGMASNGASYIMLPLPAECEIDTNVPDKTAIDDGWAVISGTSAAAPQIAGVCALLKEKDPSLSPSEVKSLLRRSALDVIDGKANADSNEGTAQLAGVGPDSATGMGLVNAFAAWSQV